MFGAKRLSLNREQIHGRRKLTPNTTLEFVLIPGLPSRRVGIHAAFDLREALLMSMHHSGNRNRPAHNDRHDRNQKRPQAEDSTDQHFHLLPPAAKFLVELTGIEPV